MQTVYGGDLPNEESSTMTGIDTMPAGAEMTARTSADRIRAVLRESNISLDPQARKILIEMLSAEFDAALRDARSVERESFFTDVERLQSEADQKKSQADDDEKRAYYNGKIVAFYDVLILIDAEAPQGQNNEIA